MVLVTILLIADTVVLLFVLFGNLTSSGNNKNPERVRISDEQKDLINELLANDKIQLFEDQPVRTAWVEDEEEWYFSIVDVVGILAESKDSTSYWRKLKQRLKEEGNESVTICHALKMTAQDGKKRLTDVANTEQLLRLIQSIPSKKAEPFKMWLAQVGRERIEEVIDPELTIERALETYAKKGYSREWINQRLQAIQVRKELTDEWDKRGVKKGVEYERLLAGAMPSVEPFAIIPKTLYNNKMGEDYNISAIGRNGLLLKL